MASEREALKDWGAANAVDDAAAIAMAIVKRLNFILFPWVEETFKFAPVNGLCLAAQLVLHPVGLGPYAYMAGRAHAPSQRSATLTRCHSSEV